MHETARLRNGKKSVLFNDSTWKKNFFLKGNFDVEKGKKKRNAVWEKILGF